MSDRHPFKGWVKSWNGPSPTEAQTWAQDLDSVYITASLKMKQVSRDFKLERAVDFFSFFDVWAAPLRSVLVWHLLKAPSGVGLERTV